MSKFVIHGGKPLKGAVRIGGAKNASFKLMIAACLGSTDSRLLNISDISDCVETEKALFELGFEVKHCGDQTLLVGPGTNSMQKYFTLSGKNTRASTLIAAILLHNHKQAIIPIPGGCKLGGRPIDRHLEAFSKLGVEIKENDQTIELFCRELIGTTYRFYKKTHTGTEALILLASKAKGRTIIENAALEPEIDDLIAFINKMGGHIKREMGDRVIIDGVNNLNGAIHKVMSDRNEAVSYAVAALATKGDVVVENANPEHLQAFLQKLDQIGARYEIADYGIRFWYEEELKATTIETQPEPGFMTDWQPLWTLLMTQAHGQSQVVERIFANRFQFVSELTKMGAQIMLYEPQVDNPQDYYEFDLKTCENTQHGATIIGPSKLQAIDLDIPDLRAGATLTIAALIAPGKSTLTNIEHIERGYERLDERLRQLGAKIEKTP